MSKLNDLPDDIARKHLFDYEQCCIRARHDAVDAAVMWMKTYYIHMVKSFGIDVVNDAYPHHAELRKAISIVEKRVLLSREERHKRVELYTEINEANLTDLISKFNVLIDSEEIMKGVTVARDREHRIAVIGMWVGVIGAAVGIIGVAVAVIFGLPALH